MLTNKGASGSWMHSVTVSSIGITAWTVRSVWLLRVLKRTSVPALRSSHIGNRGPTSSDRCLQFQEMPTLTMSLQDGTELPSFSWETLSTALQSTYGRLAACLQSSWPASRSGRENQMWINFIWSSGLWVGAAFYGSQPLSCHGNSMPL